MSEETNNAQEQETLSPEELAKRKKDLIKFYKDQIELLKPQNEYHDLLATIEENKLRRLVAMVRQSQLMAPDEPAQDGDNQDQGEKKERTLKRS